MGVVLKFPTRHHFVCCEALPEIGGCSICGGFEGEVPTDCPGELMTDEQKWAVLDGTLDYIHREGWTKETRRMRLIRKAIIEEGQWP